MKNLRRLASGGFLKATLPLLLSLAVSPWFLSTGSLAYASSVKQQPAASHCPAIPAHFDAAHASKQELHQYLLPARPPSGDQQAISDWMRSIAHSVCVPDTQPVTSPEHGQSAIFGPSCSPPPSGTLCNPNWNGYVVGDGSQPGFNDVMGDWNVQCVTTSTGDTSRMGSWVGLGGGFFPNDSDLWQVGSGWNAAAGYYLFYEAFPRQAEQPITAAHPHCGDHIHAEVWFAPNNPTSNVGYAITDNGVLYRGSAPSGFQSGQLSAEWVDERPGCIDSTTLKSYLYKLADYNYSEWTKAWASPNNPTAGFYPIGSFVHTRVWVKQSITNNTPLATADYLGSETGSGTDNYRTYWQNAGSDTGTINCTV